MHTFGRTAGRRGSLAAAAVAAGLLLAACGGTAKDDTPGAAGEATAAPDTMEVVQASAKIQIPQTLAGLTLSDRKPVGQSGAGQTLVRDATSGAVYMAWARDVPGATKVDGEDIPKQAVVAKSTDDGRTFSEPVVVSTPEQKQFYTATANPAQLALGRTGEVYLTYTIVEKSPYSDYGASLSYFSRSEDGGKTFSAPVRMVTDEKEGLEKGLGTSYMNGVYVAKDGDLFYSFLDEREVFLAKKKELEAKGAEHSGHGEKAEPPVQLRTIRSADKGATWSASTLVGQPVCGCCGTVMTENGKGELFAGTRSAFMELEGSYDAVRDIVLAKSTDDGRTWSPLTKVHDDGFKVSGCPDVAMGLASDSTGKMHVAWYTGTESHPGVYYANSDDGQTWTKPLALLHGRWSPYADVRLVVDSADQPWVAFEDRGGDKDKVQLARVDPASQQVSFSEAVEGRGPAIAVGDGWALLTYESLPASEDEEGPVPLNSLLAKLPSA